MNVMFAAIGEFWIVLCIVMLILCGIGWVFWGLGALIAKALGDHFVEKLFEFGLTMAAAIGGLFLLAKWHGW